MNSYVLISLSHIIVIFPLIAYLVWALSQPIDDEYKQRKQLLTLAWILAFIGAWGAIYHGASLFQYSKST